MQGKKAMMRSSGPIRSKTVSLSLSLSLIRFLDFREQVYLVVGLPEVVLNVVVLGGDAQLDKFVFERPGLLEETMYLSFNLHILSVLAASAVGGGFCVLEL